MLGNKKKQERGIWSVRVQEEHNRLVREDLTEKVNLRKYDNEEVTSIADICGKKISVRGNS